MSKILMPLLFLGAAIAVFFYFTDPLLTVIDEHQARRDYLIGTLKNGNRLIQLQADLLKKLNDFPSEDLAKLEKMLPNNIDNVRLIIDLNTIAKKYGMSIKNPDIVKDEVGEGDSVVPTTSPGSKGVQEATISFAVSSSYEVLQLFLADLARSLRIVDIENLSFSAGEKNSYDYKISLKTYWVK